MISLFISNNVIMLCVRLLRLRVVERLNFVRLVLWQYEVSEKQIAHWWCNIESSFIKRHCLLLQNKNYSFFPTSNRFDLNWMFDRISSTDFSNYFCANKQKTLDSLLMWTAWTVDAKCVAYGREWREMWWKKKKREMTLLYETISQGHWKHSLDNDVASERLNSLELGNKPSSVTLYQ